ncbi:MAG: hypothetical protein ACLQL8_08365 [Thermoplasmata archaeon]
MANWYEYDVVNGTVYTKTNDPTNATITITRTMFATVAGGRYRWLRFDAEGGTVAAGSGDARPAIPGDASLAISELA